MTGPEPQDISDADAPPPPAVEPSAVVAPNSSPFGAVMAAAAALANTDMPEHIAAAADPQAEPGEDAKEDTP